MTETGWPLIPREALPAPVPTARARTGRRDPQPSPDTGRQLSMFAAETTEPSPADLAGLLAGPGRLGRMGGTARVSVTVDDAWRVHVLVAELVSRGLVVSWLPTDQDHEDVRDDAPPIGSEVIEASQNTPDESSEPEPRPERRIQFEVRTAYSSRLNGLARAWPTAAAQLFLSGPPLRLWVAAAGEPLAGGYALGLDPAKDRLSIDAALVRAGLAGRVSDDGRHYVIMGKRRLARLAELVGERPAAAPEHLWPGGAGA